MQVDNQLQHYEFVADTSGRMLEAARRNDWDAVVAEERRCRELIGRLQAAGDTPLSEAGRLQKQQVIRKVLADDAEIRNLAQPWLQHLERVLTASDNGKRLDSSYGRQP